MTDYIAAALAARARVEALLTPKPQLPALERAQGRWGNARVA